MWAYRSYNDDAPAEPEPRFPSGLEDQNKRKGVFSWSSLYPGRKEGKSRESTSPIKTITGFLTGRSINRDKPRSRRASSVASSLFSRRSGQDERLDKIIEVLELLVAKEKVKTSSMRSRQPRLQEGDDNSDSDVDGDDEDDGDDLLNGEKRSRLHAKRPTSSRQNSLGTIADASVKAAIKDWHDGPENGKGSGLKERLKSSMKAAAKEAGKSGLREINGSLTGRPPSARIMSIASDGSVDDVHAMANPITSELPDLRLMGMSHFADMLEQKKKEESKSKVGNTHAVSSSGKEKDRHSRFKHEVLQIPENSPGLDEDLLSGLLPPADGYDLDASLGQVAANEAISQGRKQRTSNKANEPQDSHSRPLHYDPSLPSVQSFAWPDTEEIAEHASDGRRKAETRATAGGDKRREQEGTRSIKKGTSRSQNNDEVDADYLIKKMLRSSGMEGIDSLTAEDIRFAKAAATGRTTSRTKARHDTPRSLRDAAFAHLDVNFPQGGSANESFGIAWPSTPTHEPGREDSLPEYISPATEALNLRQEEADGTRSLSSSPRPDSPTKELLATPRISQENVLFRRIVSTMACCLGKAKELAQKHHRYQAEKLSPSAEAIVLRVIGSWLMKQIPPLERASELFSFAEDEGMFEFLEGLIRMDSLLGHPVLERQRWDSDVYEHLQAETSSLQKRFLGVASLAVVNYLEDKSSRLTADMPRVLHICYEMLKERPKDPAQVLLVLPKIRAQLRDARSIAPGNSRYSDRIEEAEGLLDILYELTVELCGTSPPTDDPRQSTGPEEEMVSGSSQKLVARERSSGVVSRSVEGYGDGADPEARQSPASSDATVQHRRGLAADFYNAPTPSATGFSRPVLQELERTQAEQGESRQENLQDAAKSEGEARNLGRSNFGDPFRDDGPSLAAAGMQVAGSLLMEKQPPIAPTRAAEATEDQAAPSDQEGRGSSSSSDEGYQSGMDASSILPILLRKKLEGKKKSSSKPLLSNSNKLGLTDMSRDQSRALRADRRIIESPRPVEIVSRETPSEVAAKTRAPGSYFPAAESLTMVPKTKDETNEVLRMRPGPTAHRPSVYTPVTASPLRASTSVISPEEAVIDTPLIEAIIEEQRPTPNMTSPTGLVFSNPFSGATKVATQDISDQVEKDEIQFYTPMPSPITEDMGSSPAAETVLQEIEEESATETSDDESIKSNEVMTSEDVKAGLLDGHPDEDLVDQGVQPLTEAEKDLVAREPEALVPGPRSVITSRDVRDHLISYGDFSTPYQGAVPRVEVTPGAIQNTKGEVIPIDDEDIHLAAGETLIDGTGRVWNVKGMIEPGRDDQGEPILYEVDIAQIKRANNGEMPVMMPWDDERLLPEGSRTPSYSPTEDFESELTPQSELSSVLSSAADLPLRRPSRRRISDGDLDVIDRQLAVNGMVDDIPEVAEDDDAPMDDIEMQEAEDDARVAEEDDMRTRRLEEQRRMGLIP